MNEYLSRDLLYQKIRPLRDAAFGADCLTPLRILKIITVRLKMDYGNDMKNCCMRQNFQILIRSPLKVKSLHILSKFRGYEKEMIDSLHKRALTHE